MQAEKRRPPTGESDLFRGLAAGLIGGLVASWTMNQFQTVWSNLTEGFQKPPDPESMQRSEATQEEGKGKEDQDDATVKAARAVSKGLFDHELEESEKKAAGAAVHYALGTSVGGLYGALAELAPEVTIGSGLPFGAAFWLVADETAVPLLGLSKGPLEYPLSTHGYALASHFVYGLTVEIVRRAVRSAI